MAEPLGYARTLFVENQAPHGRWLLMVFAPALAIAAVVIIAAWRSGAASFEFVAIKFCVAFAITAVLLSQRLVTVVNSHELQVRYWILRTRRINLADIAEARVETFEPIREFGGWGIKWSLRDSTTGYTMTGNRGVRLVTARGEKLLIGSQRPDELLRAIEAGRATGFREA